MSKLHIKASLVIQRPVHEVFEAIVDPNKMSNYFISSSTGRMEEGKTLSWKFPEVDMKVPVKIDKIERDKYISYWWGELMGAETLVEIALEPKSDTSTMVRITEKERDNDDAGIKWLMQNTEGWANFLACLKAYMEFGINLRKGAFDISQIPEELITKA